MVFLKFDMHVYTFELTSSELKAGVADYLIPTDLHPRLPPPRMMMDKLPSRYIRLYVEQLKQGDLHDDFPSNFNQDDVERLSEFLVSLLPPPRHLLYVCGLTMACRHPGLLYSIKDQDKNVIGMDTFLKLPTWTGTIVSKGDPSPKDLCLKPRVTPSLSKGSKILNLTAFQRSVEMPNTKIAAAREKKKNSLARTKAKRATQSYQSSHQGHELVDNLYVPTWELQNDLCVCTYRTCRELVNHVATPAEDEFLGTLLNVKLNHVVHLHKRRDTDLAELERLGSGLRKANQDKDEINKKFTLLDNAYSECTSREKELLDMVKSLAAPVQLCFTAGWLGRLALGRSEEEKIADSYDLPLSELWSVHPDAPLPEGVTLGAAAESTIQ
nr:hypothetical protein [Tanacetum cinerariifolium]